MKVAFLVNNSAIDDARVVKTAHVFEQAGHQCIVLGCSSDDRRDLVSENLPYTILRLTNSYLAGLFWGTFPRFCVFIACRGASIQPQAAADLQPESDALSITIHSTASLQHSPANGETANQVERSDLVWWKRILKPFIAIPFVAWRFVRSLVTRSRKKLITNFVRPQTSIIGVRILFGRYLRTFTKTLYQTEADIFYCHELWLLETAALVKRLRPETRLVYDSHELELHRNNDWSDATNKVRADYEHRYISSAELVVTVCESIADFINDEHAVSKPFVVPNAPLVSLTKKVPENRGLASSLGVRQSDLLVYTGKVTTGRGVNSLPKILTFDDTLQLAFVGSRVKSVVDEMLAIAHSLGVQDRIYFVDPVSQQHLVSFISDAGLALVPIENICLSYYYALPNKIFESAMAGLPILASNLPELEKFIEAHNVGLCVDFGNPASLNTAIQELRSDPHRFNSPLKAANLSTELSFERPLANVVSFLAEDN